MNGSANHLPLTPSDLVVIGGYLVLVLLVGLFYRRRMHSAEDYFAGGHQIPWWLAAVSHYMSSASALAFVSYSQVGYVYGWTAVSLIWVSVPGCIVGGLIFARQWRRARVVTPVEFLERRFNPFVRQLLAWAGIPMKVAEDGLKLFAASIFIAVGLGIPVTWAVVTCGVITIVYTFMGGLWALIVTDYIQFLMKMMALTILVPLAIWRAGGLHHAVRVLPKGFFHATNGPYNWVYLLGWGVMLTITLNGSWSLAQKFYSVKDEREAAKASYFSALLHLVGGPLMILPAILARTFLPDLIAQHRTADVYVLLVIKLLPAGMVGIVIAAMLSATMATVSADFSSIASVLTKDVYQRLFSPDASTRKLLNVGRLVTLIVGGTSLCIGLYISQGGDQALFHLMVLMASAFIAPSFVPLMGALVSRRLNWQGVTVGYFLGLAVGLSLLGLRTWYLPLGHWPWLKANFDGASVLINTAVTVGGMWIGTMIFGTAESQQKKYNLIFGHAELPAPSTPAKQQQREQVAVIAFATAAVGVLLAIAGVIASSPTARLTDIGVGLSFIAIAAYRIRTVRARRHTAVGA
jgi:SSS family solute:Na+ symporter